jgi:hypothetical protein
VQVFTGTPYCRQRRLEGVEAAALRPLFAENRPTARARRTEIRS